MLCTGAVEHPIAFPDPIYGSVEGRMKGKLRDGLRMTKEGARRSIRLDKALPVAALSGWPTPLPSLPPSGKQYERQSTFVSTSHTCLHKRALFQHLSGSKLGRGRCLAALAPRQDVQLHTGLLWICLAGEDFLTQVHRETF